MSTSKQPIDLMLDGVQWQQCPPQEPGDLPHVTHEGELDIFGLTLKVYRLSDGRAIIDAEDMERVFALLVGSDEA